MKRFHLTLLLFVTLMCAAAAAHAQPPPAPPPRKAPPVATPTPALDPALQQAPLRGALPGDKKPVAPREPTPSEQAEANSIFLNCSKSENQSHYFDCQCLSLKFLELRIQDFDKHGEALGSFALMDEARKACVNTAGLAGKTYNECRVWAVQVRQDAEQFCSCYANAYAKTFAGSPTSNIKVNERLMVNSMQQCGGAKESQLRVEQEREIMKMQQNGTYQQLFPGAEGTFFNKPKPAPQTGPKPKTPAQILSDHLNQSYTGQ